MLTPRDVVAGARITAHPNAYVVGCFDTRITFYAQQVRALELAHALQHEHLLPAGARIAVIGGGAAGVTLAAALALQGGTLVHLFEMADVLLPLQRDSQRRRLDPHIYEWPRPDAEHELAELPLLDWRSGSAVDVREAVLREFAELAAASGESLLVRRQHEVMAIEPGDGRFLLTLDREGANGARERAHDEFDIVILAIGFGIEPRQAIAGTDTPSYWLDAGVPGPEIEGKARPTFFVSGSGDGGLIDLIAAGSRGFSHETVIRSIAQRPGVRALSARLLAIDERAREAEVRGEGFDFIAAYDAAIGDAADRLGLIDEMRRQLRPGVQLFLQTREPELLSIRTARLNRLAVYLMIKACERAEREHFDHVVCNEARVLPRGAGAARTMIEIDCGGRVIAADRVIARRGPAKDQILEPFAALLAGHAAEHDAWVRRFPKDSIAPELAPATHAHFARLARAARIPPPRYRLEEMRAAMPVRVKLSLTDDCARWSGDLAVDDVANAWSGDAPPLQLAVAADPDSLGCPLAHAVARLTIHAPRARLMLDVARWRPFLEALSTNSPSAGDLVLPELRAAGGDASILAATISTPEVLAGRLNRAMDNCMLARIDLHLRRYLEHGDDPGRAVSFAAAADLRAAMLPLWDDWRDAFLGDPGLLARFLRLAACAKDHPSAAGEGATLVGPRLATPLIRACAVALAVATGWRVIAPRLAVPGNLARENEGAASTGHACAAGYIDGEKMALAAVRHMWTTEFVLLPMEAMPVSVLVGTNTPLTRGGGGVPLLDDVDVGDKLMLTVDRRFQDAAQSGAADLAALLTDIEEDHFARLKAAINAAGEEGALG